MMKVTALVENTRARGREDLGAEHGLSLYIQRDGMHILFDTGASEAFAQNAERMGIDIQRAELAVISHHHSDHGGGLAHFLETNHTAKVYLRRWDAGEGYFRAFGIINRPTGLDKTVFQKHPGRFVFIDEFTEIAPNVFILVEIGSQYPQPKGNRYIFVREGNALRLDSFDHELVMVIREKDGLVVFTGCSHRGILNMVAAASSRFSGVPIKAVFGGFHLVSLPILNLMAGSPAEVESIGRELLKYPIEKAYTGHCTGARAYRILRGVMGEKLEYLPTGGQVEVR
jgi:7,8-dihydropterin-6-yl-methyl-4-(beta-D-ribofuranosyl)aminobenzene 5'-phosphate synthase